MRRLRQSGFALSAIAALIGIILLLNITAQNPTGRRYASEPALMVGTGGAIGLDGERILELDLRQPNNNADDQKQCLCNTQTQANTGSCNACVVVNTGIHTYRIPDFVTPRYIAEVKNRASLPYTDTRLARQLEDYALAAQALGVPLWVYVRADTRIDPQYEAIVRSTGGDILPYLVKPGHSDPWDQAGWWLVGLSGSLMVIMGAWEWGTLRAVRHPARPRHPVSSPPTPSDGAPPQDANVKRAEQSVDYADDFLKRATGSARRTLDEDDTRQDFRDSDPENKTE